jgi:RNA polymerase sigma-70 factor (ECF subfamily)
MKTSIEGEDWFFLVKQGDKNAFRKVFDLYYRPITYFATKILQEDTYAEDIVSETFRKAWDARERFETPRHLENFLYFVTRNACISFLRADRVAHSTEKEWSRLSADDHETTRPVDLERTQTELINLIYHKLEKLPGGEILRMAYLEGKSTRDIARELNITENTVYIAKSRSLKLLRSLLSASEWTFFILLFFKD